MFVPRCWKVTNMSHSSTYLTLFCHLWFRGAEFRQRFEHVSAVTSRWAPKMGLNLSGWKPSQTSSIPTQFAALLVSGRMSGKECLATPVWRWTEDDEDFKCQWIPTAKHLDTLGWETLHSTTQELEGFRVFAYLHHQTDAFSKCRMV